MKHTPGPWTVSDDEYINAMAQDEVGGKPTQPEPHTIASCYGPAFVRKPNAHLIAAAPDLLEACKQAFDELGATCDPEYVLMVRLRAAIAKAEGE